jgi:hypothetical protein
MQILYGTIQSKFIYNWLAPSNVMAWHHWTTETQKENWWENDVVKLRNKGEELFISLFDKATGHFTDLEKSISKRGIIDPVKCITGIPYDAFGEHRYPAIALPPNVDPTKIVHSHIFGGSRLMIAQKLGIENIPCILYNTMENDSSWLEKKGNRMIKVSPHQLGKLLPKKYSITQYDYLSMPVIRVKEIDYHSTGPISEKPKQQKPIRTEICNEVAGKLLQ